MSDAAGTQDPATAAVVIGRNEGERLLQCLASLEPQVARIVYVDSGSTDGSVAAAHDRGVEVVALDMARPFTAARARNAGLACLEADETLRYVMFVDGDCELHPGWIAAARTFLDDHPRAAAVCGRLRERHPRASVWNGLLDEEWAAPSGPALACGGNAVMRLAALGEVGPFDPSLIAGEEPELCFRLRQAGWEIWRLDAEMALHDAAMTRFGQWWQRSRRAGYTYAEGAAMHGASSERYNVARLGRALFWGAGLPLLALVGVLFTPWALLLLLLWPLQVLRLRRRGMRWTRAAFLTLAKIAEAQGAATWVLRRLTGGTQLIEYK